MVADAAKELETFYNMMNFKSKADAGLSVQLTGI